MNNHDDNDGRNPRERAAITGTLRALLERLDPGPKVTILCGVEVTLDDETGLAINSIAAAGLRSAGPRKLLAAALQSPGDPCAAFGACRVYDDVADCAAQLSALLQEHCAGLRASAFFAVLPHPRESWHWAFVASGGLVVGPAATEMVTPWLRNAALPLH